MARFALRSARLSIQSFGTRALVARLTVWLCTHPRARASMGATSRDPMTSCQCCSDARPGSTGEEKRTKGKWRADRPQVPCDHTQWRATLRRRASAQASMTLLCLALATLWAGSAHREAPRAARLWGIRNRGAVLTLAQCWHTLFQQRSSEVLERSNSTLRQVLAQGVLTAGSRGVRTRR